MFVILTNCGIILSEVRCDSCCKDSHLAVEIDDNVPLALYLINLLGVIMNEKKLIYPRKLSGFMELSPSKQMLFDDMVEKIRKVYKNSAFMPLDTPVLEYSEILMAKSGGSIDKEVYAFKKGDTDICMRYDLTVPLARYVAMNANDIAFPFKRYQIGKVYRGEKAQKGRFREFYQCDADIVGLDNLPITADGEILEIVDKVFKALNLKIVNHISNRNILFGYIESLGLSQNASDILTILDKIDKIGKENALIELSVFIPDSNQCQKLIDLTLMRGSFDSVLEKIKGICTNETYKKGVRELEEVQSYLEATSVSENNYILDISVIRGQNYYTGTVFEAKMPEHPEFSTVCGGGRYDNLASYYTDKKMPGVGLSIGLTRLFDLLDSSGLLPEVKPTNVQVQILPMGNDYLITALKLKTYLGESIICEVNYEERNFKSKMKEANRKQIPYVIIIGEEELANDRYTLKDMTTGEQALLSKEECKFILQKSKRRQNKSFDEYLKEYKR